MCNCSRYYTASRVLGPDTLAFACWIQHRLLALPRPSLKFMQYCIALEANLASLGDNGALKDARRLYDSALDLYPQEREVWRSYYDLELKVRPQTTTITCNICCGCRFVWNHRHAALDYVTRWEHRSLPTPCTRALVRCWVTPLPWLLPGARSQHAMYSKMQCDFFLFGSVFSNPLCESGSASN